MFRICDVDPKEEKLRIVTLMLGRNIENPKAAHME